MPVAYDYKLVLPLLPTPIKKSWLGHCNNVKTHQYNSAICEYYILGVNFLGTGIFKLIVMNFLGNIV